MKKLFLSFLLILSIATSYAQFGYGGIGYNMGVTAGNSADYIEQFSWRGFSVEGHGFVSDNITLGGFYSLNTFNEELTGDFVDGTRTINGTQIRYINASPIMFEARYHTADLGDPAFYAGLGVGMMWVEQRTLMGVFEVTDRDWQFGLSPHIGFIYPIGYGNSAFNISARYNAGFDSSDLDGQSYLSLNVGLIWF